MVTPTQVQEAADFVMSQTRTRPRVGMILGSGLSEVLGALADAEAIPYALLPHFPQPTVEGHTGELLLGTLAGESVGVLRGRVHLYEGYSPSDVGFPVRLLRALGCDTLVVTNAAGGLNPVYQVGDLMLIGDHVFLPGMVGASPLLGTFEPQFGPRFVYMGQAYDAQLRRQAREVATENGITLREGVYAMVAGPHFETPAESAFLRLLGADAVGMSTCPEVVVARQMGMRVLGISVITNLIAAHEMAEFGHQDVLAVAAAAGPALAQILEGVLAGLTE